MAIERSIVPPLSPVVAPSYATGNLPWEIGGSGGFDPSMVPGLLLRLVAAPADITEAGTGVSQWLDRVARYAFTQGADPNRPSYLSNWRNGQGAVDWNGTTDVMTRAFATDALLAAGIDNTVYLFGEVDTVVPAVAANFIIDFLDGRQVCGLSMSGGVGWFDTGYKPTAEPTVGAHSWCWTLVHGVANGSKAYQDGTLLGSATVNALGMGGTCALGRSSAGAAQYFDGKMGELLVFQNAHTTAVRDAILAYGNARYDL